MTQYGITIFVGIVGLAALISGTVTMLDAELTSRTRGGTWYTVTGTRARIHGAFIFAAGITMLSFLLPERPWRKWWLRTMGATCALLLVAALA